MSHTLFENSRVKALASGSFVNATYGGTGAPVSAADYEYHAILAIGSFGNTGTVFAFAHKNSSGGGTTAIGSIVFGSSDFSAVVYEVKSDVLTGLGTDYTHLSGQIKVDAGGTVAGALSVISTWPRSAGTAPAANGYGAVGTALY